MDSVGRLSLSLRKQGLWSTANKLRSWAMDYLYDLRYGLDTCATSELAELTIGGENKARGYRYQPTRVLVLRKFFRLMRPLLPPNGVLVDFGSGKGRILLVASEFGFREARGVEFAHELCEAARKNIARYKARPGVATEFKVIEGDAARYEIGDDENVFMMFNPFDDIILGRVLDNIVASLRQRPRKILIIYYNPRWANVFEQRADFLRLQELNFSGLKFLLYSNAGPAAQPGGKPH